MLIERQVAPALIALGGALVLPTALAAFRGLASQPAVGTLIAGNLLAGVGLFMGVLVFVDQAQHALWRALVILVLGGLAVILAAGTALVAFQLGGTAAILPALAATAPLVGAGAGFRSAYRDSDDS